MNEELKSCPFCGGRADYEEVAAPTLDGKSWTVGCEERYEGGDDPPTCFGYQSFTTFPTKKEAAKAWNRRAGADEWKAAALKAGHALNETEVKLDEAQKRIKELNEECERLSTLVLAWKGKAEAKT